MASNNHDVHPEFDPNMKIKDEPGTTLDTTPSTSTITQNIMTNIKVEPGLPTTTRLPSFRAPRDLTLGGNVKLEKPKRVFTPNVNVARRNKTEDTVKNDSKNDKGRGRERIRNDRGKSTRGRGRGRGENLIQTSGIFSEGLADVSTGRRSGAYSRRERDGSNERDIASILQKPKLSIPQKINKTEEAEKLKELLRDDFIDDGGDIDMENAPVILPIKKGKLFKLNDNLKIKEDINIKDGTLSNGEVKVQSKIKQMSLKSTEKEPNTSLSVPQILESSNSSNYILLQLPDCLPGVPPSSDSIDPKTKRSEIESSSENKTDITNKYCTLNDLKEGMLGKLQILSSGKVRLILGDNNVIMEAGSSVSFRQDLIAAKIRSDNQSGDLVNIGRVNNTLICVPDWEDLLKIL